MKNAMRINSQSLCFFTGIMTMIHLVILFPYEIYMATIFLLVAIDFIFLFRNKLRLDVQTRRYLSWYGLFVIFVVGSLIYTVNTINPDYVIKRVVVIFALGWLVARSVRNERNFRGLANGLIFGAVIVAALAISTESGRLGIGRIGKHTVGSSVALSGIMLVAYICSLWYLVFFHEKKMKYGITCGFLFLIMILTGSRRAILLSLLFIPVLLLLNKEIDKSKKTMAFLVGSIVVLIAGYILIENEAFYSLVGWRFESMLQTILSSDSSIEDASMLERTVMRKYAIQLFHERPIFGYGVHGFAYKFSSYYGKLLYSHAGFVEILSCYGLIGFFIYYRGFILILLDALKIRKKMNRCHVLLIVYAIMTFSTDMYTISFITPQVVVMLTAGMTLLSTGKKEMGNRRTDVEEI